MATAKHYALNSMENARFKVDVMASEEVLQEVYLPHFRKTVEAGVLAIMSAYNSVNGEWAGENEHLLEEVLRGEWGFKGVVVSDFIWGLRNAAKSLRAGMDVEECFAQQRVGQLEAKLEEGKEVTWDDVDRSVKRILATQIRHYANRETKEPEKTVVFCDEHRKLAREAAQKSMVLLQNEKVDDEPVLPLSASSLANVAVIGRLANAINTGDGGSSSVKDCPEVVTAYDGIKGALPNAKVSLCESDDVEAARKAASSADVSIIVVGYTAADEGEFIDASIITDPVLFATYPQPENKAAEEAKQKVVDMATGGSSNILGTGDSDQKAGGDRESLRLRPIDAEIIKAVAGVCKKTIVCVITAGAVIMEEWRHEVPGLVISWYSGTQGGNALADVLLGNVDAGGRLPYSIPTGEEHLPEFDMNATSITYDRWHGQRLLDHKGWKAAFPLGFGLSYTTFDVSDVKAGASKEPEEIDVSVKVKNTGERDGRYIIQVYGKLVDGTDDFPSRVLLGFAPVDVKKGESKTVSVIASTRPLKRWENGNFVFASKSVEVECGWCSGDEKAVSAKVDVKDLS